MRFDGTGAYRGNLSALVRRRSSKVYDRGALVEASLGDDRAIPPGTTTRSFRAREVP